MINDREKKGEENSSFKNVQVLIHYYCTVVITIILYVMNMNLGPVVAIF